MHRTKIQVDICDFVKKLSQLKGADQWLSHNRDLLFKLRT